MLQSFLNEAERRNENCLSPAVRRDEFFHFSKASLETINISKPANEVHRVRLVEKEHYSDSHSISRKKAFAIALPVFD